MTPASAAAAAAASSEPSAEDPEAAAGAGIVKTYNEGVIALNAGDLATAKAKFTEAIEKNPEYGQAYGGMARVLWKEEAWQAGARQRAQVGRSSTPRTPRSTRSSTPPTTASARRTRPTRSSRRCRPTTPRRPASTCSTSGADLYNSGNIAEAKKIFEAILAGQPNHAKTHYMLGLCYVGEDNKAKAKEHLGKFLELAPNDPDAGTAQEMIKYLSQ